MPRRTLPGATITANPNPVDADIPTAVVVRGSGFPDGPVNVGFHGEASWVDGINVTTGTVSGGTFEVTLPTRAYLDNDAFEFAEMYLQARGVGDGNKKPGAQVPMLLAATILYVERAL